MFKSLKVSIIIVCCFSLIGFQSCTNTPEKIAAIAPPSEKLDVAPNAFEFLAEEEQHIKLNNGGSLEIPANAFVDENGLPINGKVSIEYREFHEASSIITSGIPMVYEENGKQYHFQTAGMFEIRGYQVAPKTAQLFGSKAKKQKGKPIFINQTKQVKVNMASFTGEGDYNFYLLDDENGQWKEIRKSESKPNEVKLKKLEAEAPIPEAPKSPEKHDSKKPVFELNFNANAFPELAHFEGIMWEYSGTDPQEDPSAKQNAWINKIYWSDIAVKANPNQEGAYRMTLKTKAKQFSMDVKPVLSGRNYKKAMKKFEQSVAKFEAAKQKRKAAEERLADEANFIRSASISQFGVYNHDRYYSQTGAQVFAASFKLDNGEEMPDEVTVFLVTGDDRTIIKYPKSAWNQFRVVPYDNNKLVTILPNNQVGVYGTQEFKSLLTLEQSHQLFKLRVVNNINSFEELQDLMAKL
ncbi:MAG: hypothetical protein ACPGJS_00840 [Flammeovirgaceae bacterium]